MCIPQRDLDRCTNTQNIRRRRRQQPPQEISEEEKACRKEAKRLRAKSRQYKKGLANRNKFDPSIVPGGRHYFLRYCVDTAALGNFLMRPLAAAAVSDWSRFQVRNARLNSFCDSIRVYNNVLAFTSIGASETTALNVDDSVTRDGVYNFRVQGTVCHRMGSLLTSPNRRNMFAQVYINDPDMATRVESRMGMTDGLDREILKTIDHVMETHNEYARFLTLTISWRRVDAGESTKENPALRLNDFLPENEDLRLRLHVTRHANPETHNTPTACEIAAIVIDQGAAFYRDILLKTRGGE
ncbi:Helitron helicase [Phytophthora megakarya]|uniref:Helitron helicase n=1 Tax=Phytophthora megakarya TaxID=4795 RepID=A0A225UX41_9STRA|nr:Helitron helicase [Phytophthora megakarya]